MLTLFQVSGSPAWPGLKEASGPWCKNATWDESTEVVNSYVLPDTLTYRDNSMEVMTRLAQAAFRPGGAELFTRMEARQIELEGDIFRDTSGDLDTLERAIKKQVLLPHLKLKLDSDRYINLAGLRSFKWVWRKVSGRRFATVRIVWDAADPFWYSWSRTTDTETIVPVSGEYTWTVTPSATLATWPMFPEIQVQTAVGQDLTTGFSLINETDEDLTFEYLDPGHEEGADATFNSEAATADLDGTNSLRYFSGEFLRLLPGANSLKYAGTGQCTIRTRWRERWP